MATFYDNFSGRTLDTVPSDMTVQWESADMFIRAGNTLVDSDKHIQIVPKVGSFAAIGFSWDVGTTEGITTVRILAGFIANNGLARAFPGALLSGSGNTAGKTGYSFVYEHNEVRLFKYDSGADSIVDFAANTTEQDFIVRYLEVRRDGSDFECRVWKTSESRPTTATVSYTDPSALPLAGFFGFSLKPRNANTVETSPENLEIYEIAVGTNGDAVPTSSGPSLTVTQAELTPGGQISGTYSNYETVPTTLTVSDGTNTIQIPSPGIVDDAAGGGTFDTTMPSLPSSGTASLVLFGNVTVELS